MQEYDRSSLEDRRADENIPNQYLNQRIVYEIHRLQKSANRHSPTALVMMLMGKSYSNGTLSNPMCSFGRYIGMGYVACRLFDMNISKQIKSSKPDFLYTEQELGILPGKGFELSIRRLQSLQGNQQVMQYPRQRIADGWEPSIR